MDRYEEIRRTLLGRHPAVTMWGVVVLRTRGMAAWARSWREYGEGGTKKHKPSAPPALVAPSRLPPSTEEVVRVLSAMVWAIEEEAVS